MTDPEGTDALDCVVMVPTTKPAFVIAVAAAACVRLTTFGTLTCDVPVDTTRFTGVPGTTDEPDWGFWLITEPDGTDALDCPVMVPTARPVFVIAVVAAACARFTTFGTVTLTTAVMITSTDTKF